MEEETDTSSPSLKRPRPIVSCLNCRRKKLKCDRRLPCEKCIRSGKPNVCAYAPGQLPIIEDSETVNGSSKRQRTYTSSVSSSTAVSLARFEALEARVCQLERAIETRHILTSRHPTSSATASPLTRSRSLDDLRNNQLHDPQQAVYVRHEVNINNFEAVKTFARKLADEPDDEESARIALDLHSIHQSLMPHTSATKNFNLYSSLQDVLAHMERLLPDPTTCTTLAQLYFEYFENCLRILHRGTSWTQFRAFINGSLLPDRRQICLPLLLAALSIAASLGIIPACESTSLHGDRRGVGAYHLLRNYLNLLPAGSWKELSTIQLALLTLRYHKSSPLTVSDQWHWTGQVVRRMIGAGMHLLHSSQTHSFETELHRRLWLTGLEFDLAAAAASDMPASCPMWQGSFPLNIDDSNLWPGMSEMPQDKPVDTWTQSLCQHVLAQSFNARLSAYNLVASSALAPYDTVLEQARLVEQHIRDVPTPLRLGLALSTDDEASDTPARLMAQMEFDFLLRRPLTACYTPYAAIMSPDDRYKEARIMWVQNATFSMCFQDLFDPKYPTIELAEPRGLWDYYYNVYWFDVERYFLANCLELQRLRSVRGDMSDVSSPAFQAHTLRSPVKVLGWNIEGITKSLEDTIDPMARRLGRHGSDFPSVVKWTATIGSLRGSPSCSSSQAIKNELQTLVHFLRGRNVGVQARIGVTDLDTAKESTRALRWLQKSLEFTPEAEGPMMVY